MGDCVRPSVRASLLLLLPPPLVGRPRPPVWPSVPVPATDPPNQTNPIESIRWPYDADDDDDNDDREALRDLEGLLKDDADHLRKAQQARTGRRERTEALIALID